ncbi:hypothetical protein ACQWF0_24635, partial [Salmonella enterica subsp. enterica serovar Infantis]
QDDITKKDIREQEALSDQSDFSHKEHALLTEKIEDIDELKKTQKHPKGQGEVTPGTERCNRVEKTAGPPQTGFTREVVATTRPGEGFH